MYFMKLKRDEKQRKIEIKKQREKVENKIKS